MIHMDEIFHLFFYVGIYHDFCFYLMELICNIFKLFLLLGTSMSV
jgi:hypothetical protein